MFSIGTWYELWFAYDGWNLLAEWRAEPVDRELARTYQWGTDLSGSPQGAGGIGGLLLINTHTASGTFLSYYPCYGDNGNIEALLDVSDPQAGVTVAAAYEYGPFGEPLRATGAMAKANPFRWSTKYTDEETGLVYYGYRFYDPHIGRWINRDPIGERGGHNSYRMTRNNALKYYDFLGLEPGKQYDTIDAAVRAAATEILSKSDIDRREYGTSIYGYPDGPFPPPEGKWVKFSYGKIAEGPMPTNIERNLGTAPATVKIPIKPVPQGACFLGNIHSHPNVPADHQKALDFINGNGGSPPFSGKYTNEGAGDLDYYDNVQNAAPTRYQMQWFLILSPGGQVWSYLSPMKTAPGRPNADWDTIKVDPKRFKHCCTIGKKP